MIKWLNQFNYNPVPSLLKSGSEAITLFTQRDLLDNTVSIEDLWQLPEAKRIVRRQKPDGSWIYPGGNKDIRARENYNQLETYRNLGILVELFGFNKKHPAIRETANYLFTFQNREGDFRGIYGNQYSPNYTAGITELLIKAGYEHDTRIDRVFKWLLDIRQEDGGWAIRNIVSHLRDAQGVLRFRLDLLLEQENPSLESKAVFEWATKEEDQPPTTREIFDLYRASRQETIAKLESIPLRDWWRTGEHEEFGTVTLRQQVSYFGSHEITHLPQIESLRNQLMGKE